MSEDKKVHENCDCGCGCEEHEERAFIEIEFEDGVASKCEVIDIFEVEEKAYIAVLPEGEESVLIYGFEDKEEGPELLNIEDEALYEKVCDEFISLYEEEEEE